MSQSSPTIESAAMLPPHTGVGFVPTTRNDTYPSIDPTKADFSGKVVLITGASKGIGKGLAITFAQAGASGLVLLARSDMKPVEEAAIAAQRPGSSLKVLAIRVDISNFEQVTDAAKKVEETFGRIDIVINNAGVLEPLAPIAEQDPKEWWKVFEINVLGTYNVTHAFLPLLIQSEGSKILVIMTSIAAHSLLPLFSGYQMTKLALTRFAELITEEYGDKGVLVHAVNPGMIQTDVAFCLPKQFHHLLQDTIELAAHTTVWLVRERREWLAARFFSCQWDVDEVLAKKDEIVAGDKLKVRMVV